MKINLWFIISDHIETLSARQADGTLKRSYFDLFLFFGTPILLGYLAWHFCVILKDAVYELSVSVFAIFSALLLSVQVAMYGVFRASRNEVNDEVLKAEAELQAKEVKDLLREININISYLILLSCLAVSVFLIFFSAHMPEAFESAVLIAIYVHFVLTLAMVLKRAHVVFDSEYRSPEK